MDARLQRRIQRYGWDLAAGRYEALWQQPLAPAHAALLALAAPARGERVLDVACGTGLLTLAAARAVGDEGQALGTDLSGGMVDAARQRALRQGARNAQFLRMDAEQLALPDAAFDIALCALGLMYVPDPLRALREMRRCLRPGGRAAVAVWGERARCGWSAVFDIVDAEVASEVCPLFFRLGHDGALQRLCADAGLRADASRRIDATLEFADADAACQAAFVGGPAAMAWSRFTAQQRARACERYLDALQQWRHGNAYRVPGEFVVVAASAPGGAAAATGSDTDAGTPADRAA